MWGESNDEHALVKGTSIEAKPNVTVTEPENRT